MELIEVKTEQQGKDFLEMPTVVYQGDPNYIRPLDNDISKVFDPNRNKYFKHGQLIRWLLKGDNGRYIGRVSAFINESTAYKGDFPTGGMGFFECINDQEAANLLFDTCKEWLAKRGMEAMDGPVNFGERHNWWGLLVEGYTEPCYGMNYQPPYYKDLFEAYGFKLYFNQLSYGLGVYDPRPDKYYARAKELRKDPNYSFRHLDMKQVEEFTEDMRTIYNQAFINSRDGLKEMSKDQAIALMKALKPVVVDYLMWFGYYKDEPIAMFLMLPELNQYFKHVNGKMNWLGKLKFLYHKTMGTNHKMFGMMFGVVPGYQGQGVEGGIIMAANDVVQAKKQWTDMELIWIGDFNPKMMRVAENLGAKVTKRHVTYRKLFDPDRPFERYPIVDQSEDEK